MVRFKNRYLVGQLTWKDGVPADGLNEAGILAAAREALQLHGGDLALGASLSSLQVKYYSTYTHVVVIRCDRNQLGQVRQALANIRTVLLRRVSFDIRHTAGTVQRCRAHALQLDKAALQARSGTLPAHHMAAAESQQAKLAGVDN